MVKLVWLMVILSRKDVLKYAIVEFGPQYVTGGGAPSTLMYSADQLDMMPANVKRRGPDLTY